ncbi:prion-inhibition and propagation-domain-containing protein [Hypoxylon sp. FL1284]|nr:prion-inhibition and propagation-domain-containing protein [Hypoxylon sp. FL1284]
MIDIQYHGDSPIIGGTSEHTYIPVITVCPVQALLVVMAAEVTGLVLSVGAIVAAFKGAVETGIFVKSFFDEEASDSSDLGLHLLIEQKRLQIWGELCKAKSPSACILRDKPDDIKKLVIQTLGRIEKLGRDADVLVEKYDIGTPAVPEGPGDLNDNLHSDSVKVKEVAKHTSKTKAKAKWKWVIYARDSFKEKIEQIHRHTDYLHQITVEPRVVELLENGLPSRVLPGINDSNDLRTLSQLDPIRDKKLGISALAKLHQQMANADLKGLATRITTNDLYMLSHKASVGRLKQPDGTKTTVLLEWNTFGAGPDAQRYSDRINSLGYILEKVSNPGLRLPPCYGVLDDACGADVETKRVGYVFGLPPNEYASTGTHIPITYERDICSYPPVRLSELIRRKSDIPLLGDRFQLAYVLACAFSCFHAAKWLHKGFHTGSIFFYRKTDGRFDITAPFITGFQYSRPQGESSLAYSPLQKPGIQHYYHPEADGGFTKKKDLYSLGVVLCEIGRWSLLADQKNTPKTRQEWKDFLLRKVLVDLGWRMGDKYQSAVRTLLDCELPDDDIDHEFFAEQFLDKVMKLLSSCSA